MTKEEIKINVALGTLSDVDAKTLIETSPDIEILQEVFKAFPYEHPCGKFFRYNPNNRDGFSIDEFISLATLNVVVCDMLLNGGIGSSKQRFTKEQVNIFLDLFKKYPKHFKLATYLNRLFNRTQSDVESYLAIAKLSKTNSIARRKIVVKLYNLGHFIFTSTPSQSNLL